MSEVQFCLINLGVKDVVIEGETSASFDSRMKANCPEEYDQAKMESRPTEKQIKLCEDLIDCGASFHLRIPHLDNMFTADKFIKENYHLLKSPREGSVRATERTRAKFNSNSNCNSDFYKGNVPSDFGVWNS